MWLPILVSARTVKAKKGRRSSGRHLSLVPVPLRDTLFAPLPTVRRKLITGVIELGQSRAACLGCEASLSAVTGTPNVYLPTLGNGER